MNGRYLRPHSSRLVRTSMTKGLTQKHINMAIKILNTPLSTNIKEKPIEKYTCQLNKCIN